MSKKDKKCLVLGAGVTGLAVAWKLAEAGHDVELVELSDQIGGAARTFKWREFLVDTGPHKFYTHLEGILESVKELLGDELITVPKKTGLFLQGRRLDFPFRLTQLLTSLSPIFGVKLMAGFAKALVFERGRKEVTYEDWIVKRFGWTFYRSVFEGLADKIWSNPRGLSADLARRRIVTPGVPALLKNILLGKKNKQAPAPIFYYPRMGISRLSDKLAERLTANNGSMSLKHTVKKIAIEGGCVARATVVAADGSSPREAPIEHFVSTIPLAKLFEMIEPAPSAAILAAARALTMRPIMLGFIAFRTPRLLEDVWTFFPDRKYIFNRISEQKGFSEAMGPPDQTVVCFDVTAGHMPEAWNWPAERVLKRCLDDLRACGFYKGEEVTGQELFKLSNIYPIYDLNYQENLRQCLSYLESIPNLFTTGRAGLFCYNNTDQCLDMGYRLAKHIAQKGTAQDLRDLLQYYDGYEIVD